MATLIRALLASSRSEEGQALAEVSLILAFVAVVCVLALTALGLAIVVPFNDFLGGF